MGKLRLSLCTGGLGAGCGDGSSLRGAACCCCSSDLRI